MFDVSIYTDSTGAESLDGVDGFNFQGASDGFTPVDRRAVQEYLLHQVVTGWSIDNDPLAHPPSCRYRPVGDRFYLARGRSTGKTNNGRPGNQLTQSVVTADIADFAPYRPAQLFGARRWCLEKAEQNLEPWVTPLEIDPEFEASELKDVLLDDSWAVEVFPAFLTMIEEAVAERSKKLVIVHDDLDVVMKWIALGTLFLDLELAVTVKFAALVKNPLAVDAAIVGTSSVFDPPPLGVVGGAYNVFDVLNRQATPVEVSRSARDQAEWFIELDAEDALAAVELARTWEPAMGADDATRVARLVQLGGSDLADGDGDVALRAVISLVESGQGDDVAMYADELSAAAKQAHFGTEDDVRTAARALWSARRVGADEFGFRIAAQTLRAVSNQSALVIAWAHEMSELSTRSPADPALGMYVRQYENSWVEAVNDAPAEAMSDLLVVANAFALEAHPDVVRGGLARFAEYWARNPGLSESRTHRMYRQETTVGTVKCVVGLLEQVDREVTADLLGGRWDWVPAEMRTPLDGWIAAARIAAVPPKKRAALLGDERRSASVPPAAWSVVLAGAELPADASLIAQWIDRTRIVPLSMGRWLADEIDRARKQAGGEGAAVRPVLKALLGRGVQIEGRDLDPILGEIRFLSRTYADAKQSVGFPENRALDEFAARIGSCRSFFMIEIGSLLIDARDARALRRLVREAGDVCGTAMAEELRRRFERDPVVTLEVALFHSVEGLDVQADSAREFLTELADSRESRMQVEDLKHDLPDEWVGVWDELLGESKKGRMGRNLVRGGKRLFGKEG